MYINISYISISYYEYFTCFTTASPCSKEVASKASATVKRSHLSRFSRSNRDENMVHNEEEEDGEDDLGIQSLPDSVCAPTRKLGSKWRNGEGIDKLVHNVPRIDTFARNSSYIFLFLIVEPMSILR